MSGAPALLVAGASSGVGKTSLSLGLCRAFARRDTKVRPFKAGPDFLDPTYLSRAADNICYNLDSWMCGRDYVRRLFAARRTDGGLSLVEGVMGLHDGADPGSSLGSSAELAMLLDIPVLLVVDAHGMSRSIAALVKGYAELEPGLTIAGVIANRIGSPRHAEWLSAALDAAGLPPLLGAVPRGALPELPSRHLGLVTAGKDNLSADTLNALADGVEQYCDLEKIMKAASSAGKVAAPETEGPVTINRPVRLAVARDKAFHFYYPDMLEAVEEAGGEVIPFSPLADAAIPPDATALYLGGGYPEVEAKTLSANTAMLASVRSFVASGRPVYAECGGLVYLTRGVADEKGETPLAGVLPVRARMRARFKNLGYVEAEVTEDTLTGMAGQRLRGHRFHYSELEQTPADADGWHTAYTLTKRRSDTADPEGWWNGNVLASYMHAHLPSNPKAMQTFIHRCGGNE